jgi:transposase
MDVDLELTPPSLPSLPSMPLTLLSPVGSLRWSQPMSFPLPARDSENGENVPPPEIVQGSPGAALSLVVNDNTTRKQWRSPEVRLRALQALKTAPYKKVAKDFGVTRQTLTRWQRQFHFERTLKPRGGRGRKKKLTLAQVRRILTAIDRDPTVTNEELAQMVGNAVHPATISKYTRRAGLTRKQISDDMAETMSEQAIQDTREYLRVIADIPWDRRVYMDESFVYDNEAPRFGRAPRGRHIYRPRECHGNRWTIYFAIRPDGMVHAPIMRKKNANDEEFVAYVKNDLAPCLRPGDVVIWDRLGRAGRCRNPTKQHYSPEAKAAIEAVGASVLFLPPKGKYFNPIELSFGTLKTHIRNSYAYSPAAAAKRPRTEGELRCAVQTAADKMGAEVFAGYFRERADGRGFAKAFPTVWNAVQ